MGAIYKDTKSRVSTLCGCSDYAPDSKAIRDCMAECSEFVSRAGGWCLHYRSGSKFCTHLIEKKNGGSITSTMDITEIYI